MGRRHKHEEHENHERWLVSYADFITLLFAFFVVMYAISQVNEGKYKVLSNTLTEAFSKEDSAPAAVLKTDASGSNQTPIALPFKDQREAKQLLKEKSEHDAKMKAIEEDLKGSMAPLLESGQVQMSQNKRGVTIEVNASLLFPVGSATLNPEAAKSLASIAEKLASGSNLIQIEGHTDDVPINTAQFPSNWELSASRAGTVVRLFESTGVAARRLVALGFSANRPLEANENAQGRSRNRRVTIQILADSQEEVATLPLPAAP